MSEVRSPSPPVDADSDVPLPTAPPTSPLAAWVGLGIALLGGTFALFAYAASRSVRAEERGDLLAATVLSEARAIAPLNFAEPWEHEHLYARVLIAATARGLFAADLEVREPRDTPSFGFLNKHYCIEVRPSPRSELEPDPDRISPPIEVMAWPRSRTGPARSVYFHPDDADAAYSRNLQSGYVDDGSTRIPVPGRSHRRNDGRLGVWDYRGFDDERWLLEARPAQ